METVEIYPDVNALVEAVAEDIAARAKAAIHARGRFAIGLSGGSTPRPLFERLASPGFRERIAWGDVCVFWGDDRTVPPDHEESNFRLARMLLLDHVPIPHEQIFRIYTELEPHAAAAHYDRLLHGFFKGTAGEPQPRFDYLLQGMGPDGHTASLFPHTDALKVYDPAQWVVANYVPKLETWRVTLTAHAINAARRIVFMVEGESKADPLRAVLQGPRQPEEYPSQLIDPVDGELAWMVDATAAAKL